MNLPYLKQLVKNLKHLKNEEPLAPVEEPEKKEEPVAEEEVPAVEEPEKKEEPVAEEEPPAVEEPAPEEKSEIAALKEEIQALHEELHALQEELLKSTAEKEEAQNLAAKLTTGLRTSAPVADSATTRDFHAALKEYRDAHPGVRYSVAFANVAKSEPALYQSMFHR